MKNLTNEALLTQLGYQPSKTVIERLQAVIKNTKRFENIKPHLLALHDNIKNFGGLVALSSSNNYFKIKNEKSSNEVKEYIEKWANKYKINLREVEGKNTYYIIGTNE